jgi:hypothetical protein
MFQVVNVVLMLPLAVVAVGLTAGAVFYVSESERLTRTVGALGAALALWVLVTATGCASTQHCPQAYGYDTFTSRPNNPW